MHGSDCLCRGAATACWILVVLSAGAIVGPAPERAFCRDPVSGDDIVARMAAEAGNPLLAEAVVRFANLSPVDVDGDEVADFEEWSGVLISPEWVLTCAHTLQGSDGMQAGIVLEDVYCYNPVSFPDAAPVGVAEIILHPEWELEDYAGGHDLALVRLATPIHTVGVYPRLNATAFVAPQAVMMAGYGYGGDGDTGGTGGFGTLRAGINTLDVVGGDATTDGEGDPVTPYPGHQATTAFMDFDKGERQAFDCGGGVTNPVELARSELSSMGFDHALSSPAYNPCVATNPPAIPGTFTTTTCDFLPVGGDSGCPIFSWPTAPNGPEAGYYLTGVPTVVGVSSSLTIGLGATRTGVYGNAASGTLVEPFFGWIYQYVRELADQDSDGDGRSDEEEWLAGTDPYRVPLAPATFVPQPVDVLINNIRILAERLVGATHTDIEFAADLVNLDTGRYLELAFLVDRGALSPSAELVDPHLSYPTLPELGAALAGSNDTLVVRVDNAELAGVRQMILSGELLEVAAFEEQVYTGPTQFIDPPTDDAFTGTTGNGLGELVLLFDTETDLLVDLAPGDILIADTAPGGYRPKQPAVVDEFAVPYLSQQIPFEVSSVSVVEGEVHVAGHKRNLLEILKSGTFLADDENFNGSGRDLLDPPVENTYTEDEADERDELARMIESEDPSDPRLAGLAGLSAIPWHFNELKITDYLQLSGEVLLRSSGLRFQISFRDFAIKRASVGLDAGIAASLLLETTGTNDTVSLPLAEKQKDLARIPLPAVPVTIAGVPCSIAPEFVLAVGAEATAPAGLTLPLEASMTVGADIGWSDGQTFATPIQEFVAPRISDPTVFEAVTATAAAWVDVRLEVKVSVAGGAGTAGPALGLRAEAGIEVAPFANPWWTVDADADLVGRFDLSLLGFNVAGVEATQPVGTFFHAEAGGPLVSPRSRSGGAGLERLSAHHVRWARTFVPSPIFGTFDLGFVVPVPPSATETGGGLVVGGANVSRAALARFSGEGELTWMKELGLTKSAQAGAALPDGRVAVAGLRGSELVVSLFDGDGNRAWAVSHLPDRSLTVTGVAVGEDLLDQPEIYVAGHIHHGTSASSDPALIKFDAAGTLLWASYYAGEGDDEALGIALAADGDILLCGRTDADVAPPELGTPDADNTLKDATFNGLLMRIDPADGSPRWALGYASRWGMNLEEVVEAPGGTLYAAGAAGRVVSLSRPVNLFMKLDADGELLDHTTVGDSPDWEDELPNGGNTPYDVAAGLAWADGGLWAAGTTGLGAERAGWVMRLTDELGVKLFSVFDGPNEEVCLGMADTGDGLAVLATTRSAYPWGSGGESSPLLLKLPGEALMRFHEDSRLESRYLRPQVFHTSATTEFQMLSQVENTAIPQTFASGFGSVDFLPTALNLTPGASVPAPTDATSALVLNLDELEPTRVENYSDWLAYHQLSGDDTDPAVDIDGDGLVNLFEAFFGRNPYFAETDPPLTISVGELNGQPAVVIAFDRSTFTQSLGVIFEDGETLDDWLEATGLTEIVQPLGPVTERVKLVAASELPVQFFRFVAQVAGGRSALPDSLND